MTLKEFVTKWTFKIEKEPLEKVDGMLDSINKKLEFLAAAEVIRGIAELGEKFAHFAEEIHVAAENAGITSEAFQKLAFAAKESAVSQEEMSMGMARLSRTLYEARKGGEEAQKAFAEAGFSQEQIAGFKTGQDALLALSSRMSAMSDPIQKQALAMQLMGRGSANMVSFLSQGPGAIMAKGNEAQRLGIVLNNQQIESLVKLEHSMTRFFAVFKGLGAFMASQFAPSLEFAIDRMLKFYEANKKLIEVNVKEWVYDITYALGFVHGIIERVLGVIFKFIEAHGDWARRISEIIAGLTALSLVVFGLEKGAGIVKEGFGLLWDVVKAPVEVYDSVKEGISKIKEFAHDVKSVIQHVKDWNILQKASAAAQWLWNAAVGVFTGEISLLSLEFLAVVAAVGALVVIIHDLWKVFFDGGKWEDTWIGQAFSAVKNFGGGMIGKLFGGGGGGMLDSVMNFAGMAGNPGIMPGAMVPGAQSVGGDVTTNVNAPITISVPPGTDTQSVAKSVQAGVKEHLDRTLRETRRSLTTAVSH